MIKILQKHLSEIEKLCRKYNVKRLEVFGSGVDEESFDPQKSDIDFLVEFLPLEAGGYADSYFGMLEAIEELLGRKIDLVMPKAIKNRYFLESINKSREVLYAA